MLSKRGVYAGTFGPLHQGHKKIIDIAMEVVDHLTIGLVAQVIAERKVKGTNQHMPFYTYREQSIRKYMEDERYPKDRYDIVEVRDGIIEGVKFNGDVMFLSDEDSVVGRANHINTLRKLQGKSELILVIIPRVRDSGGDIISSTRIRMVEKFRRESEKTEYEPINEISILKKPIMSRCNSSCRFFLSNTYEDPAGDYGDFCSKLSNRKVEVNHRCYARLTREETK